MAKKIKRLYEDFKPEHYLLDISINKKALKVTGSVKVTGFLTKRPSNRITLHQNNLKIKSARLTKLEKTGSDDVEISRINKQNSLQEVRLHTKKPIYAGKYQVLVEFESKINQTEMVGAYESKVHGHDSVIIATQFESHHARKCFPCIDEPEAKATYDISISSDKRDVILSNTNEKSQAEEGSKKTIVFHTTPKMSSYLVAFVVGDLHCVQAKASDGTLIRSWASTARDKKLLTYSIEEAVKVLDFFSNYYQKPYPLDKLDLVALPDFDAGAMENWGLTTFREIVLLADPDNRSISTEQYVSLVVAHELAHQWFGDLVTMKWWDDLWLNESFASLMEHLSLDKIHPDWKQWELYASQDLLATTNRDIYKDIQPVAVKVTDPELIETLFDPGIVYAKGGRLLKMLHDYIGDKSFRDGLKIYFDRFAYKNAEREDLWKSFQEASGVDVAAFMDPWLKQPGMPIISVKDNKNKTKISQKRYLIDKASGEDDDSVWPIPLLSSGNLEKEIFSQESTNISMPKDIVLNPAGSGHFFVNYLDKERRNVVASALHNNSVPPSGEINILNDFYMLARIGASSITDALELVTANKNEERDAVWSQMLRIINACFLLTDGDKVAEKQLKNLKKTLASDHLQKLGWSPKKAEDPNDSQMRRTAIAMMISSDDSNSLQKALEIIKSAESLSEIDAELRGVILSAGVRELGEKFVRKLIDLYPNSTPDMQLDISSALSSTRDKDIADSIIKKTIDKKIVKPQDLTRWIAMFVRNLHISSVMWDYVSKNWEKVEGKIGSSKSFDFLPIYMASPIATIEGQRKYIKLFGPLKDNKVLSKNICISEVDIESKIAWRKRDEQKIKDFLSGLEN